MIPISKPFLPPQEEYNRLLTTLWDSKYLTNNGIYVQELEQKLEEYLGVPSLHFVSNGTIALQIALRALEIKGEVITTPFSFVATTTSIIWENCEPVFVDIDPKTLCIDANKIEEAITEKTEAILATHVYGIPCDVEKIEQLAQKYKLKVIYDAAHAFGVQYKDKSLLEYGDISTLSFHSTKLYHTVEGGGIINNIGSGTDRQIKLLRSFGFEEDDYYIPGINGKNSEFHAAMGLCNLKYIDSIIRKRKILTDKYNELLKKSVDKPIIPKSVKYNYIYYPIIFKCEEQLLHVKKRLERFQIVSRRYFNPSLNKISYIHKKYNCPISEDISKRVLCLPLYYDLSIEEVETISEIILMN